MKIPKAILKNLARVATNTLGIYKIGGVSFQKKNKKLIAEATDGVMLIRVEWPDDTNRKEFKTIFSTGSIKRLKSGGDSHCDLRDLETVDGVFPDTSDIILRHKPSDCYVVKFNPRVLAKLLSAITSVVPLAKPACVECVFPKAGRIIQMNIVAEDPNVRVRGAIMPFVDKEDKKAGY